MKIMLRGNAKEFEAPMTALEIAASISHELKKEAVAAKIDGEVKDLKTVIDHDCEVEFLTFADEEGRRVYRHTASHVLAQAVKALYPDAKLAIGPAIDNGFYYDFDCAESFTTDDFKKIEKEMERVIKANYPLERFELPRAEALELMQSKGEPYKVELINDLPEDAVISFYRQGDFVDLCAGPHLPSTGYVKAINGGRGQKTANRTLNRATDSLRQPGSTFKVISSFAPALDACGATLSTVYYDGPYSSGEKEFRNWWGSDYKGYHTIRDGITYSMNIVALRCMADTVTPQLGVEYAERLGITSLVSQDQTLSTALGGLTKGVSNLELTNAFAAIANGGTYTKPIFFTKILDRNGKILIDNEPETRQALKDSTAYLLTSAMQDVMQSNTMYTRSGSGVKSTGTTAAIPNMSCAGKSGTTTSNVDVWFVGFTPYYTAGIWGGCDNNQPLKGGTVSNGGTSYHKRIWRNIMTRVHESLSDPGFTVPDSIETAEVCRKSGKLPVSGVCSSDPRGTAVYTEYFAKGTVPTETCDHHTRVTICSASGGISTAFCPTNQQISKTVMVVPEDGGETDDSRFSMPGECKIHNGSSTIIHPSESADFSAPGYSPDSDNLSAPIHSVVPRPMTGSGRSGNNIPIVPANPEH